MFLPSWVLLKAEKHLEEAGNENHNWLTIQNIILLECFIKYWHAKVVLLFWNHWTPKHKTQRKKNINSKGKATDDSILTYTINPQGILLFISILKLQKKPEVIHCGSQTCPIFFCILSSFAYPQWVNKSLICNLIGNNSICKTRNFFSFFTLIKNRSFSYTIYPDYNFPNRRERIPRTDTRVKDPLILMVRSPINCTILYIIFYTIYYIILYIIHYTLYITYYILYVTCNVLNKREEDRYKAQLWCGKYAHMETLWDLLQRYRICQAKQIDP